MVGGWPDRVVYAVDSAGVELQVRGTRCASHLVDLQINSETTTLGRVDGWQSSLPPPTHLVNLDGFLVGDDVPDEVVPRGLAEVKRQDQRRRDDAPLRAGRTEGAGWTGQREG